MLLSMAEIVHMLTKTLGNLTVMLQERGESLGLGEQAAPL